MLQLLLQKPAVSAIKTSYSHGFMNLASAAFNEQGYQQYLALLQSTLLAAR